MARGGGGDITSNDLGQGFTSLSPCTYVQGVSGAPTAAVGGAADSRRTTLLSASLPERPELTNPQFLQSPHSAPQAAPSTECGDCTGVLTERRPRSRSVTQTPPTPFQLFVTQMTKLFTPRA